MTRACNCFINSKIFTSSCYKNQVKNQTFLQIWALQWHPPCHIHYSITSVVLSTHTSLIQAPDLLRCVDDHFILAICGHILAICRQGAHSTHCPIWFPHLLQWLLSGPLFISQSSRCLPSPLHLHL